MLFENKNRIRKLAGLLLNESDLIEETKKVDNQRKSLSTIIKYKKQSPLKSIILKPGGATRPKIPTSVERLSDNVKTSLLILSNKTDDANDKKSWNDIYHSFKSIVDDITLLTQATKEIQQQSK